MKFPIRLKEPEKLKCPFRLINELCYTLTLNVTLFKFTDPLLIVNYSLIKEE